MEAQYFEQLNYVNQRLSHDPADWGDPIGNYWMTGMVDYHAMHKDLNLRYAVYEPGRRVYLYQVTAVPHRALE